MTPVGMPTKILGNTQVRVPLCQLYSITRVGFCVSFITMSVITPVSAYHLCQLYQPFQPYHPVSVPVRPNCGQGCGCTKHLLVFSGSSPSLTPFTRGQQVPAVKGTTFLDWVADAVRWLCPEYSSQGGVYKDTAIPRTPSGDSAQAGPPLTATGSTV
jgi:hypothetical protein